MEADFGYTQKRTKSKCQKPMFADNNIHRIAILKDFHIGSKGDTEESGLPGWVSKFLCTECGKRFKIDGHDGFFHPDKKQKL